jgi:phosphatidylglycerophosphate synthase
MAMAAGAVWLALEGADVLAVSVCIAAAWLDAFDGWYARRFSRVSSLGAHLDPLADKVLMGVVYVWIGIDTRSSVAWCIIALIAAREIGITFLRVYSLRRHGRFIPASPLGRAKMLAQSIVGLTTLSVTHYLGARIPAPFVCGALVVILGISVASAVGYIRSWRGRPVEPCLSNDAGDPGVDIRRASVGR